MSKIDKEQTKAIQPKKTGVDSNADVWENQIARNAFKDVTFEILPAPESFRNQPSNIDPQTFVTPEQLERYIANDFFPLPITKDREGYCGDRHFEFWLLGLRDYINLKTIWEEYGVEPESILDFGCASGRILRHLAANEKFGILGCDINAAHVTWCLRYLPKEVKVFQNTSIPYIALPDSSVDIVTAYSVFTHIEAFETSWLMEIRRILKPGGIAYLTAHTDHTLKVMQPDWPIWAGIERHSDFSIDKIKNAGQFDRIVFRFGSNRSYSSNVFLHTNHIKDVWGRFFEILDIRRQFPLYQDAIIMRRN